MNSPRQVIVNGDDPRWLIRPPLLSHPSDFPVTPGLWVVEYRLEWCTDHPSARQLASAIFQNGWHRPDWPTTTAILDAINNAGGSDEMVVGICGVRRQDGPRRYVYGCVTQKKNHRRFLIRDERTKWEEPIQVIAVVKTSQEEVG